MFLMVLDVPLERLQSLARGEQISDGRVDHQIGGRYAKYPVAEFHCGERVVYEEVASHELVDEELLDQGRRGVSCKYLLN